tara:strand:- start:4243 stop:5013 length:771 start_codon:yes stop_codon:yes gene_type:complete
MALYTYLEQTQRAWQESGQSGEGLPTALDALSGKEKEMRDAVAFSNTFLQNYQNWDWLWQEITAFALTTSQNRYTAAALANANTVVRSWNLPMFYVTPSGGQRGKLQREKSREVWKQERSVQSGNTGAPTKFYVYPNNDVEFGPLDMSASHTIDAEYWRKGTDLNMNLGTANTDLSGVAVGDDTIPDADMDEAFDDIIWQMAAMMMSEKISATERSETCRAWLAEQMVMMGRDNLPELAFAQSEFLRHQNYFGDQA